MLFETAIVTVCLGVNPTYQQNGMCNKVVDAGTRQAGIRQQVDMAEEMTTTFVNKEAERKVGKLGKDLVGTSLAIYKMSNDKKAVFQFPGLGICSQIRGEVTESAYNLNLEWNF